MAGHNQLVEYSQQMVGCVSQQRHIIASLNDKTFKVSVFCALKSLNHIFFIAFFAYNSRYRRRLQEHS